VLQTTIPKDGFPALQGIDRFELGWDFVSPSDLHELFHLIRECAFNCDLGIGVVDLLNIVDAKSI
jgi:hypothetical protein